MKIRTITSIFVSLLSMGLYAQVNSPVVPDTPPSPQAVAFTRLGNYEVNNNYGVPDINIPLFEIDFHGFKIPLTLHYEASPIKPGYNYDVTGLGWTLSGNSCVSRTIKDRADEYGLFNNPFQLDQDQDNHRLQELYSNWANELDHLNFQYDSYNVVLPSGRTIPFFMYKSNGQMKYTKMSEDSNVIIYCNCQSNKINYFVVTDEQGIQYYFTVSDTATNGYQNDFNAHRPVTWMLTEISIPAKGVIRYEYNDPVEFHTYNPVDEPTITVSRLASENDDDLTLKRFEVAKRWQTACPEYKMRLLSRISYGPTTVNFTYRNSADYYSTTRPHMERISVYDSDTIIKKITFGFDDSCLTSLEISGQNDIDKLKYNLEYHNRQPGTNTDYWGNLCISNCEVGNFNMYFDNEALDSTTISNDLVGRGCCLIPNNSGLSYYYKLKLQQSAYGDSRIPSPPEYHGVLRSIKYPNGGSTSFEYENHRFLTANSADGDIVFDRQNQRVIEGGGFRIKSITNFAADGITVVSEDHYEYGFANIDVPNCGIPLPTPESYGFNVHTGYGEAVVDPNILTFMTYSYSLTMPNSSNPGEFRKMIVGLPSVCNQIYHIQGKAVWWDAVFSANTFRSLIGGRRPVVYPEITVYHGGHPYSSGPSVCKSKTVYKYDKVYSNQLDAGRYYLATFGEISVPATGYFEPLGYPHYGYSGSYPVECPNLVCWEDPALRHQLTSKSEYSCSVANNAYQWDIVSEEKYKYSNDFVSVDGYVFNSVVSRGRGGRLDVQESFGKPWDRIKLEDFYTTQWQRLGRNIMTEKKTTVFRQGGTCSRENTISEHYSYLYPGAMSRKMSYSLYNTKGVGISYIGTEDENGDSVITEMKSRNMLASVASSTTYAEINNGSPYAISGNKIKYGSYDGRILPYKLYEYNQRNQRYPEDVPIDSCEYEESVEVKSYDLYCNPTEIIDLKTNMHTVFLWDSTGRYMTAMIQNARLEEVECVSLDFNAGSRSRHDSLQAALPNAMIQTWDYKPLVGVTSHTDVNGMTLTYEYDGLGRVTSVKRHVHGVSNPETIKEYEYNYLNP